MTWWRLERRFRRLLVSLSLLAVLGVLAIELLVWQWRTLEREQVQHDLIIRASDVRSTLETRLLDGIYLTRGLVFFLHSQKGMSDRQSIEGWLASMLAGATDIRNIGIAPDNRIALLYPLAGNESALGLDYRKTPAQWPAVERMMQTGTPVLAGPLQLVQGGQALLYRVPVFMDDRYWGLVSTVINADLVLGMLETEPRWQDLHIQLQRVEPDGQVVPIWGDALVADEVQQSMPIHLPGVTWRLVLQNRQPAAGVQLRHWTLYAGLALILLLLGYAWGNAIAQQREREAMRAENERLKNDFVSTVNHELRTPLTSIIGTLSLLAGGVVGELSDKAQDLVAVARRNAEHLLRLISDLLDIDKLAAGQLPLDMQPLRLSALLEAAIEENAGYAAQHEIRWIYDNPCPQAWVRVDATRFRQVLDNLLSNAVKFSPAGSAVSIAVHSDEHERTWRVSVTDQGDGIPPAFQPRVFDRFTQADGSSSRKTGGTGLGLAIARGLIEGMGGRIDFVSSPQGTCFTLHIPKLTTDPH